MAKGIKLTPQTWVEEAREGAVVLYYIWSGAQTPVEVDSIVVNLYRKPADDLLARLQSAFPHVHRIGDCLVPRKVDDAIFDGELVGRTL